MNIEYIGGDFRKGGIVVVKENGVFRFRKVHISKDGNYILLNGQKIREEQVTGRR